MGEWSKKIGEDGEDLVYEFLKMIGWTSQSGVDLACVKGDRHQTGKSPRTKHGIDRLFSYMSPLEDGKLNNLVISVKHTNADYPESPCSKFKEHFLDLSSALECFKNSELKASQNRSFSGVSSVSDIGVLFWISQKDNNKVGLTSKLSGCRGLDEYKYESIFVIDNEKAAFIYDTISSIKLNRLLPAVRNGYSKLEFFYPPTGKNVNPLTKNSSGPCLPIEYINSNVLLLKLDVSGKKTLILSTTDGFSVGSLKRLIGLAQDLSQDLSYSVDIYFPDYKKLNHENFVQEVKGTFSNFDFTSSISVVSYASDFRGMTNE